MNTEEDIQATGWEPAWNRVLELGFERPFILF